MLALLLGIPRHLSWATYARVSSNSRLLPAMQFFIPKAVTVQRWCYSLWILTLPPFKGNSNLILICRYRGCSVRHCLASLKSSASSFCSMLDRAASELLPLFHLHACSVTFLLSTRVRCSKRSLWLHHSSYPPGFQSHGRFEMGAVPRASAARCCSL